MKPCRGKQLIFGNCSWHLKTFNHQRAAAQIIPTASLSCVPALEVLDQRKPPARWRGGEQGPLVRSPLQFECWWCSHSCKWGRKSSERAVEHNSASLYTWDLGQAPTAACRHPWPGYRGNILGRDAARGAGPDRRGTRGFLPKAFWD